MTASHPTRPSARVVVNGSLGSIPLKNSENKGRQKIGVWSCRADSATRCHRQFARAAAHRKVSLSAETRSAFFLKPACCLRNCDRGKKSSFSTVSVSFDVSPACQTGPVYLKNRTCWQQSDTSESRQTRSNSNSKIARTKRQILATTASNTKRGLRSMRFALAAMDGDCIPDGSKDSSPMIKRTKGVS